MFSDVIFIKQNAVFFNQIIPAAIFKFFIRQLAAGYNKKTKTRTQIFNLPIDQATPMFHGVQKENCFQTYPHPIRTLRAS